MGSKGITFYIQKSIRFMLDCLAWFFGLFYPTKRNYLPPIDNPLLLEPAITLANKIRSGKLKSETLVRAYISRIKTINPLINALIDDRFDDAIKDAIEVDKRVQYELTNNQPMDGISSVLDPISHPFLGIPFTVKDSIAHQGMAFTSGSVLRKNIKADEDAECVASIKKAGGIAVGITNVPEMLFWINADNKAFGRTKNPYDHSRIVGGSSGGESCIQASGGSVFGVGSDIGGSIRIPCFMCGIFGHKTTPGVINVAERNHWPPIPHFREKFLSYGPMCRYASDLRPMLRVMAEENVSQLKLDDKVNLDQLKVYYLDDYNGDPTRSPVSSEIKGCIERAVDFFRQKGSQVKLVRIDKLDQAFKTWLCAIKEVPSHKLAQELTNRTGEISPYLELLKSLYGGSIHSLASIFGSIVERKTPDKQTMDKFLKLGKELEKEVHEMLGQDGILIYPILPETAMKCNVTLLKFVNFSFAGIWNVINVSATCVPMGLSRTDGLPLGLQVIAGPYMDHLCISAAEELEKEFGGWEAPCRVEC